MNQTTRPKSMAVLFMLGAFLSGAAVGFAADRAVTGNDAPRTEERSPREELQRELRLRPEQQVAFDSIFDWRRLRSRELMRQVQPSLDSVRDSARVLMMQTLDSAQQAELRRLIERNQRMADSIARARGDKQ